MKAATRALTATALASGVILMGTGVAGASPTHADGKHAHGGTAHSRHGGASIKHPHGAGGDNGSVRDDNGRAHGGGNGGGGGGQSGGGGPSGGGLAPTGNNGTIKVDQAPLTSGAGANHANHPHVTCTLALSFWGYDTGTDNSQVTFSAQPPSGKFTPVPVVSGPTNFDFTVTRRAGGGQLDTSQAYQLDVVGLKAQPKQGYHIKVTADVSGSRGADEKHKVFWYQPCSPTNAGSGGSTGGSSGGSGGGSPAGGGSGSGGSTSGSASNGGHAGAGASLSSSSSSKGSSDFQDSSSGSTSSGAQAVSSNSSSGAVPTGAGTDLGWFSPARWGLPAAVFWTLLAATLAIVGSLGTFATGCLRRRRDA